MTPMAWQIASQLTEKVSARRLPQAWYRAENLFPQARFFEVTNIFPIMLDAMAEPTRFENDLLFLPAPVTWLEFDINLPEIDASRCAHVLYDEDPGVGFRFISVTPDAVSEPVFVRYDRPDAPAFRRDTAEGRAYMERMRTDFTRQFGRDMPEANIDAAWEHAPTTEGILRRCMAALVIINNPGVIGLHVHPAHKGRIKKLSGLGVGKFPLGAWTELMIGKPTVDKGGQIVEGRQADRMPLHFVRSFWKPSLGIRIAAHYRGNAAYGIKRSRYTVEHC